jgi:hypothetical protein
MKITSALCVALLAAGVTLVATSAPAQNAPPQNVPAAAAAAKAPTFDWPQLAFTPDGKILREIGSLDTQDAKEGRRVRATAYDGATGAILHRRELQLYTTSGPTTSDGRLAVIAVDSNRPAYGPEANSGIRQHLVLLDTGTGETQDIPPAWFDADDTTPYSSISGDGRLVSAYTVSDPPDAGPVVTLYDWQTKKIVARQTSGFPPGGSSSGGVTPDGKIAFSNNRSGSNIVDPLTGKSIVHVGANGFRSEDGAWIVELPNPMYGDPTREIVIEDGAGAHVGKLDLHMTDDQVNQAWSGAFCGSTSRFVAASEDTVAVFDLPSGKEVATFPAASWRDPAPRGFPPVAVACTSDGERVAIRSGSRLTIHRINERVS